MEDTNSSCKQNSSTICWCSQNFTSNAVFSRVIKGIIIDVLMFCLVAEICMISILDITLVREFGKLRKLSQYLTDFY
jgi:hypothetical protein